MKFGIFSDASAPCIRTSGNEITDDTVEFASFVALRLSQVVFGLACAVLAKVLGGFGNDVLEELHLDAAQWLAAQGDVEEDDRVG